MSTLENRCLETFPNWLRALSDDATKLVALLADPESRSAPIAAAALNYLFKSLDLIPDGLEDLGFIDDAFVLRVAAAGVDAESRAGDSSGTLERLAGEAALIEEFLGETYPKLKSYVDGLGSARARGRSVQDILGDENVRGEFVREVAQWAAGYKAPAFHRDPKNLVKLAAFLAAKLGG
jgi:uncharacterized membrane protein YkvA (DUF1232 family)